MIAHLATAPFSLLPPAAHRFPVKIDIRIRWINPRPRRALPPQRIRLAEGVWIIPNRRRRLSPPEWTAAALCARLPTTTSDSIFFGVEHREAPGSLIAAANNARQLCARCPVAITCLTHALVTGERYGVWGGTSGRQRAKLRLRLEAGAGVDELVAECLP
jgi:WhiB family redox-sensing transcriptional regulator